MKFKIYDIVSSKNNTIENEEIKYIDEERVYVKSGICNIENLYLVRREPFKVFIKNLNYLKWKIIHYCNPLNYRIIHKDNIDNY